MRCINLRHDLWRTAILGKHDAGKAKMNWLICNPPPVPVVPLWMGLRQAVFQVVILFVNESIMFWICVSAALGEVDSMLNKVVTKLRVGYKYHCYPLGDPVELVSPKKKTQFQKKERLN